MSSLFECRNKIVSTVTALSIFVVNISAQSTGEAGPTTFDTFFASYGLYLGIFVIFVLGILVLVFLRIRASRKAAISGKVTAGASRVKTAESRSRSRFPDRKAAAMKAPRRKEISGEILDVPRPAVPGLPIFSFARLERTPPFLQLPDSQDEDLLCAVEQTREDSEEDAEMRDLALKILAAFKTRNSIEALAQMALYDLSSKLRSTAVSTLAQMDHESVFEAVITACADPTREVRAAAARGLFRLSFDRAHAWTRIIESNDLSRMRQAARAVIEGSLVERSFERLTHKDQNIAYEAYAITALLIRAGETEPIYRALAEHKDEDLKLALLHALQTIKNDTTFDSLSELMTSQDLSAKVAAKVNEVRLQSEQLLSV